jgi:hypothetical protein
MTDFTVDDIKLVLRGKENFPLVYVSGYEDKEYMFIRQLVKDVYPKTEEDMYSTSQGLRKILTTLRYMEEYDYEKLVEKIRSYC